MHGTGVRLPMKRMVRVVGRLALASSVAVQAIVVSAGVGAFGSNEAHAQSASSITVRGNQRVDAETVRSYFTGRGALTQAVIDEGIRGLYASGLFSDVRVSRAGGGIVVSVNENQVINRVAFEGNSKVKDAVLTAEVQSKSRGPYNPAVVQSDVQRITEIYRRSGRYEATVEAKTIAQSNGRVDLVFEVNEGGKTKIQSIAFEGNEAFGDGTIRDQMSTTESNFLSWIKTSDVYDPDRVNADLESIRKFYLNHGYADFRVVSANAELDKTTNAFTLKIVVEEGAQYRFGAVDVQSNVAEIDAATLRSKMQSSSGTVYSATDVDKSVEAMSLELASRGYAFAQVRPRGDRDTSGRTIAVTYVVEEGARVYVERINVRGNTRTRDYVIRREFDISEGDAYNQVFIDRAERRLKALGFFKTVKIASEPGSSPDRVIVNVDVEDQPTGEFSVAGGYSTTDGVIGEVALGERNFLGRGQNARIAAQFGQNVSGFDFSFTDPYFLGYRLSAGVDLYAKKRDDTQYTSYKLDTYGGGLRAGLPISEEFSVQSRYQLYQQDLTVPSRFASLQTGIDVDDDNNPATPKKDDDGIPGKDPKFFVNNPDRASAAILEARGKTITSLAGLSLVYNTIDNPSSPTLGLYAELKGDVAGLGGDSQYLRTTFDARYYHPLFLDDVVGIGRVQAGHIEAYGGDTLRVMDHIPGGPDLVRGFEPQGFGPRDLASPNKDPLGGTTYYGGSAEVQFPIFGLPKEIGLKGAVFADAGTVFDYEGIQSFTLKGVKVPVGEKDSTSIRSSVGASVLWNSPLGPIRFDFAKVLSKEKYDQTQVFRFSGGTRF